MIPRRLLLGTGIGVVGVLLVAAIVWLAMPGDPSMTVTAEFSEAPGLYPGNFVDVLGIPVGHVTAVDPGPNGVTVTMQVPTNVAIPADVHASLMAPYVVNDRYVQLGPPYTGGPRLADHAVIPISHTAVPVSVDQIVNTLDKLALALGPEGANQHGALSDLLHGLAHTFGGNTTTGTSLHQAIVDTSQALTGLASHPQQLAAVLNNLGQLTQAEAANTTTYHAFADNLAAVSTSLAADDSDIGQALSDLQQALGQLATFIQDNQSTLGASVTNLQAFAAAIAQQQQQLAQAIDLGPLALQNFNAAIDPNAAGGPALRARYDPTGSSMSLVRSVCGNALLRGLVVATNPAQRNELDVDCLLNYSLGALTVPPGASAGPNLSLQALLGGTG
jgi:phospholipid/cholesterol/gamma-HCH transport system substrate-binding protein